MANFLKSPEYKKVDSSYPFVEGQEVFYWNTWSKTAERGVFCPQEKARELWRNEMPINPKSIWAFFNNRENPTWAFMVYVRVSRDYKVDQEPMEEEECL